jgi:hypothetical protein
MRVHPAAESGYHCASNRPRHEVPMPDVTVLYWRDIPAQIIVGQGRRAAKVPLPERFEQAIDRCAMKVGARDSDAYLAHWRKGAPYSLPGEPEAVAAAEAARLTALYDAAHLKALIENDGRALAPPATPEGDAAT